MFMNPAITTAVAEQHRRDLITQADACRLARAARNCRPSRPRLLQTARRVVTTVSPPQCGGLTGRPWIPS